jgi:putative transposase
MLGEFASGRVEPLVLPARSPNLNAYSERWVRSVKEECLSKVILFGERSLRRALREYVDQQISAAHKCEMWGGR